MDRFRELDAILLEKSLETCPEYSIASTDHEYIDTETLKQFDGILHANSTRASSCVKCGAHTVYTFNVQTRRGDEGLTVFSMCGTCKHRAREMG